MAVVTVLALAVGVIAVFARIAVRARPALMAVSVGVIVAVVFGLNGSRVYLGGA